MLPSKMIYPALTERAQDWLVSSYRAMNGVRTKTAMPGMYFKELKKAGLVAGTPEQVTFKEDGYRCVAFFSGKVDYRIKASKRKK